MSAGEIPPLLALILNAGFQDFGKQSWTDDGSNVMFAAHYLGPWLLTLLLLKSMDKEAGRMVMIGRQAYELSPRGLRDRQSLYAMQCSPSEERNARTGLSRRRGIRPSSEMKPVSRLLRRELGARTTRILPLPGPSAGDFVAIAL